jgi:hypothetical protein
MSGLLSNPFYADVKRPRSFDDEYDNYDDEEEDYADYEIQKNPNKKRQHHPTKTIGPYIFMDPAPFLKQYNLSGSTQYLNMGSIPIIFTDESGLSFNLEKSKTVKHFFIKIDGKYYAFVFRYDYHSKLKSYQMDQEDNPSKARVYELLDEISNGAFTKSAVVYKIGEQKQRKYLTVTVCIINKFGQEQSYYNYKEFELESGVIEDARKISGNLPGVNVHITERFIDTLLHKKPNVPATPPVPSLLEDELETNIEYVRNARQTYSHATSDALKFQKKFNAIRDFYLALFITTKPNPLNDKKKFENMSNIELKNYIKKLHHIVVNSKLNVETKDAIKAYLRVLNKSPDITKILELKLELTRLLTSSQDTELIDLMGINNEVPIIDEYYFNDKDWMNHYHAGMAAAYILNKWAFPSKIGVELDNIKRVIVDPTDVSREKLNSINQSLQIIKGIFLPKLMDFLKEIQLLAEYHPLLAEYVIINLDDLTKLQQLLDRLTQLFASSKLTKTEELFQLTNPEEFEGGSRLKQKKKTRKRTKKRNKSKRHKGYSRR